jgi:transposase
MIQVTPQMRILVAIDAVDFRKGIDGMAQLCRAVLRNDPFDGTVFVFRNRRHTAIKLLVYDGRGFWLCHKRLSMGRLRWWPQETSTRCELEAHQLMVLLAGGDPNGASGSPLWRKVSSQNVLDAAA